MAAKYASRFLKTLLLTFLTRPTAHGTLHRQRGDPGEDRTVRLQRGAPGAPGRRGRLLGSAVTSVCHVPSAQPLGVLQVEGVGK